MNYYNNYNQGYYPNMQNGYGYQPVTPPQFTQPLTDAEIKELRSNSEAFTVQITPEEQARAICTHKQGGNVTLIDDGNGNYKCTICGAEFRDDSLTEADVKDQCDSIKSIIQLIKTWYLDVPIDVARNFYSIIAFIDKIPKLYTLASDNFNKHTGGFGGLQPANQPYSYQQLAMLTNPYVAAGNVPTFTPGYGNGIMGMGTPYAPQNFGMPNNMGAGVQQPQMNAGYPNYQPQYNQNIGVGVQQPQMNAGYPNYQPQGFSNPFGYNSPVAPVVPQMNTMNATPQAPVAGAQAGVGQAVPDASIKNAAPGAPVVNNKVFEV